MDTKELNKIQRDREEKLKLLREEGFNFPNNFEKVDKLGDTHLKFGEKSKEELENLSPSIQTAGRVVLKRVMGKAAFMTLEDESGRLQVYFSLNNLGEAFSQISDWDLGDIIGVSGKLFRTKTDELTIEATTSILLTKSLNPMPEKHKGLSNIETIYRQRYLDLMSSSHS